MVASRSQGSSCCHNGKAAADPATTATDPVCGMQVDTATSRHQAGHAGQTYHFCSAGCVEKFNADPADFVDSKPVDTRLAARSGGRCCCSSERAVAADAAKVADPVCGMQVDPAATRHHAEHVGRTYYFCSAGCHAKFTNEPERYLAAKPAGGRPAIGSADAIFTCPMHPEVRQKGPGSCPICGMALEPETITKDAGPERGIPRHAPPVVDRSGAGGAAGDHRHGQAPRAGTGSGRFQATRSAGPRQCSRRPWFCGLERRSSCAAGNRSSAAA